MSRTKIPTTISTDNGASGPEHLRGAEAVEAAKAFGLPLLQWGHYKAGKPAVPASEGVEAVPAVPGEWVTPAYTPEEAAEILAGRVAPQGNDYVRAYEYREHMILLDLTPPAILDEERDVLCYLDKSDSPRVAAAWLDGFLLGRERGKEYGEAIGRQHTENEVRKVGRLLFAEILKDALTPAATSLEEIAHTLQHRQK